MLTDSFISRIHRRPSGFLSDRYDSRNGRRLMAEKGRHFKSAKHGIALGCVGLAFGLILIFAPGSGSTEGGTWSAALGIPTWGLGAALVVIGGFILFLGIRQARLEK